MRKSIILLVLALLVMAVGCKKEKPQPSTEKANLVVYGDIYTAESENSSAEALAVKDGKFIYVGTKDGVKDYIDEKTTIIDHSGKGMVIPGCYEGHAHYLMKTVTSRIWTAGLTITGRTLSSAPALRRPATP